MEDEERISRALPGMLELLLQGVVSVFQGGSVCAARQ